MNILLLRLRYVDYLSVDLAIRIAAAVEFIRSFPPATELLIIGASRDAVGDFVRELARSGQCRLRSRCTVSRAQQSVPKPIPQLPPPASVANPRTIRRTPPRASSAPRLVRASSFARNSPPSLWTTAFVRKRSWRSWGSFQQMARAKTLLSGMLSRSCGNGHRFEPPEARERQQLGHRARAGAAHTEGSLNR
jgi:hypothetical protein